MKTKQALFLTDERKQLIQKKLRQLTSGNKASIYRNGDDSFNIEKLTRAIATTNSLSRHRDQVSEFIKAIFERDRRANEIIAEEMKNFNVQKVQND